VSLAALASILGAQDLSALEKEISGTWRLLRTEQTLVDGSTRPNPVYGPHPVGYVIYDPTHHMCLFLTRSQIGAEEPAPSGNGLNSYCGRWSIDPTSMTMFHETEMDILPKRAGIVRMPKFKFKDGNLYLYPPIDTQGVVSYALIFEKVRG
jgi:hypothetical protein